MVTEPEVMDWFQLPLSKTSALMGCGSKFNGIHLETMELGKCPAGMKKLLGMKTTRNSNLSSMGAVKSYRMITQIQASLQVSIKSLYMRNQISQQNGHSHTFTATALNLKESVLCIA